MDVERLRQELSHAQRTNAEQSDLLDKLKKQNDIYNARIKELKMINLKDQSETKDLRTKLRASEHERAQLVFKQGEVKNALQILEMKRKDDLREKDAHVAELKKALAAATERNEHLDAKLKESKGNMELQIEGVHSARSALEVELFKAKADSEEAKSALHSLRRQATDDEGALIHQLNEHQRTLSRVAEEYARLASSTVSKSTYEQVKREGMFLQLRINRLERKYANSEGQVAELAQLIRRINEEKSFLLSQLQEAEQDLSFYSNEAACMADEPKPNTTLWHDIDRISREVQVDILESEVHLHRFLLSDTEVRVTLEGLRSDQLLLHASSLIRHVNHAHRDAETKSTQLTSMEKQRSELMRQVSAARSGQEEIRQELVETSRSLAAAQAVQESLKQQIEAEKLRARSEIAKFEQTSKREKEARERALADLQKSKIAEEVLLSDINQ